MVRIQGHCASVFPFQLRSSDFLWLFVSMQIQLQRTSDIDKNRNVCSAESRCIVFIYTPCAELIEKNYSSMHELPSCAHRHGCAKYRKRRDATCRTQLMKCVRRKLLLYCRPNLRYAGPHCKTFSSVPSFQKIIDRYVSN
jgi:hypothetical protein